MTSQGENFVTVLKALGYPNAASLDPTSFDWMFDDECASKFLHWFVGNVTSANLLTPGHRKRYEELQSEGRVLQGEALQRALQGLGRSSDQLLSNDELKEKVERLRQESEQLSERENLLQQLTEDLSSQNDSLKLRRSNLEAMEVSEKREFLKALEECEREHLQLATALQDVCQSVTAVNCAYRDVIADSLVDVPSASKAKSRATFLSQVPLNEYHAKELAYSSAVTDFTNKKFFEAIGDMASDKDNDYYKLLEVADPKMIVARGDVAAESSIAADCKAYLRIQKIYPLGLSHNIDTRAERARTEAALSSARESLADLPSMVKVEDKQIRSELEKTTGQLATRRRQTTMLREGALVELLSKSAGASEARILTGNYNLKLARQDYFLSSQDQVVEKLLSQRARCELLSMMYEVESRDHRDTQSLLASIGAHLHATLNGCRRRMKAMDDATFGGNKFERATIDSRSTWLTTAAAMLGIEKDSAQGAGRSFVTYSNLFDAAKALRHDLDGALSSSANQRRKRADSIQQLEKSVTLGVRLISPSSSEQPPDFVPKELADASSKLDKSLGILEASILELLKCVEQKRKLLKQDECRQACRDLFRTFFTEPDKLGSTDGSGLVHVVTGFMDDK